MDERELGWIRITGAREHNLRGIDVAVPRGRLTVVTGVSGSGKSSLAFDTLFREGQRRFLETLPAFARQFQRGPARPAAASISGLGPAVAVGQGGASANPRSTVGTLTEVWDFLRLVYARLGEAPEGARPTRGLFSFNGPEGACPRCAGLGVEDRLDPGLLVADPARTLREGALKVSTPNGYLMYSQVTLEVLDQVLRAHGGTVDIPWRDLSEEARRVVLHGSDRLKIPFGKHPLESRLKWTGITARPRQEGFYKGLVPVMEEILSGKRNDSILRFARTGPCPDCGGLRLRPEALAVRWRGRAITDFGAMAAAELRAFLETLDLGREAPVLGPVRAELLARTSVMADLGLGYLTFDRPAPTLSRGEAQRLRLVNLAQGGLRNLLLVLDEPSSGLHPADSGRLLQVLRRLRDQGQTVVVVEHDPVLALGADWIVDLGPGPGPEGGEVLYAGPPAGLPASAPGTPTALWLGGALRPGPRRPREGRPFQVERLSRNNLRIPSLELRLGALNVVTGVSGAGKTSLLQEVASRPGGPRTVLVDADPIGRTPRSNPATYTGAFDFIRNLFAATAEARAQGLGKGHFTFNTPGGRCEACEGAGVLEVGMKHLGTVEVPCEACGGSRFHPDVLAVPYRGRSIRDVLEGSVQEAATLFQDHPGLSRILAALLDCGLGYLPLGQPATTLSGGEAQRVKLATELARAGKDPALILLDEPTTGLHAADAGRLIRAWERLVEAGHTLLVADNAPDVVLSADHVLDLGPGSGSEGGRLVAAGPPEAILACAGSLTGAALRAFPPPVPPEAGGSGPDQAGMELRGVTTHNLKELDITFPATGLTVVTGPSGSGKSSLVFDTLLAEARSRFNDLVAPWARRLLPRQGGAELASAAGLQAAVAVPQASGRRNPRSRVGTASGLDECFRLLFARFSGADLPAAAFSPNSEAGACPRCRGLGFTQACDPERLVTHPDRPLGEGALDGTKFGAYLGERDGRFVATLLEAGRVLGLDFAPPWRDLGPEARRVAMRGCGDRVLDVAWRYKRGRREGVHQLSTRWEGFAALVDQEYERVHGDAKGEALEALLGEIPCPDCGGERLAPGPRRAAFRGLRLPELAALPAAALRAWFEGLGETGPAARLLDEILPRLRALEEAGLGYLPLDREMAGLSGGEAQRVRLAASLGAGLTGVAYALDEPTQGLHPRDSARLCALLRRLARENAVIVVEHDPVLVASADHVVELGPGAGPEGGRLMRAGPPSAQAAPRPIPVREARAFLPGVTLRGARLHNLRNLDVTFPAGALVAVTGVSGSGKSTLVRGVLGASLAADLRGLRPVGCAELQVHLPLDRVDLLEQIPGAPGSLSTVATAAEVAEPLRRRFAATERARALKLSPRHFSTAVPGGRCEACEGRGHLTVAMDLLPDVTVGCEACQGLGFKPEILECRIGGHSIAQILAAPLSEALELFREDAALAVPLGALAEAGLGYLRLGQETKSLSGGEGQRLRLAGILARPAGSGARAAVLLDEPARGLDAGHVGRLVASLARLAAEGHLIVAVEHDPDLVRAADWVIDLGPGGGPEGGALVACGPPGAVAACPHSATGRVLAGT